MVSWNFCCRGNLFDWSWENGYKFSAEVTSKEPNTLQAKYYYYQYGSLKRVEIADNLEGIDYVYTINGWLKSINNPDGTSENANFAEDIFAMGLP